MSDLPTFVDKATTERVFGEPHEPRLRLMVTHEGRVAIRTCDHCTGTEEELVEVLDSVLTKIREGVVS